MQKKIFVILILLTTIFSFFILYSENYYVYAETKVNASFTTQNSAPQATYNMSIQDFTTHYDVFDYADGNPQFYADTHWTAISPVNGPTLMWREGFDPEEGASVKTLVCIASTKANRDAVIDEVTAVANCNIMNKFSNASAIDAESIVLDTTNAAGFVRSTDYLNPNRTVWLRFASYDNKVWNYSFYDTNITIINVRPDQATDFITQDVQSPLSADTHNVTPVINWTDSFDRDNGVDIDHYPADDLDYYLYVGDSASGQTQRINAPYLAAKNYILNISEANFNEWDNPMDWLSMSETPVGSGYSNKTYYFRIITNDGVINSSNYDGSFSLYDYIPNVKSIEIKGSATGQFYNCTLSSGTCWIDPVRHSNSTINFQVNITDLDADCNINTHKLWAHLCYNTISCNENIANYTYNLDYLNLTLSNQENCTFSISVNQGPGVSSLAPRGTPKFYEEGWTNYRAYVNITSQAVVKRSNDPMALRRWVYNQLMESAFLKSPFLQQSDETNNVTVGGAPSPQAGVWSSGDIEYRLINWGNVNFTLEWNTSAFTGPGTPWTPDATWDFLVDDDNNYASDPGGLPYTSLRAIFNFFQLSGGIKRCITAACNNNVNESLSHYWHIHPPIGLSPGTWSAILNYRTNLIG